MSRIGKQLIPLADKVEVIIDDRRVTVRGPKGELTQLIHPVIEVEQEGQDIVVRPMPAPKLRQEGMSSHEVSALWGLTRSLVFNMTKGVIEGFQKKLEIEGVGYKAQVQGEILVLSLGFSHPVELPIPEGITIDVTGNAITISGIDKALVGQVAANIRALKKPEPYKGKGIHYVGEHIRRKAGKKAATT